MSSDFGTISLCKLCVLCVSVVGFYQDMIHRSCTEKSKRNEQRAS
jgi:hypothetical protein